MPDTSSSNNAQRVLARCQGLRQQLQVGEHPVLSLPAIWDSEQYMRSEACEVILTNQRIIGFYHKRFPREKLFCDTLDLARITQVSMRQKTYGPLFREILLTATTQKLSIRAPRQKSERLYTAIHTAISAQHASDQQEVTSKDSEAAKKINTCATDYSRETIQTLFESSPLAMAILLVGGIVLEIMGGFVWSLTQSSQVGLPLCGAGFVAVMIALWQARQYKRGESN